MIIDVGADQHEEVSEHAIAAPISGQFGEAIKDADALPARCNEHVVDRRNKGLKTVRGFKVNYLQQGQGLLRNIGNELMNCFMIL